MRLSAWMPGKLRAKASQLATTASAIRRTMTAQWQPVSTRRSPEQLPEAWRRQPVWQRPREAELEVVEVRRETADAVTVVLANDPRRPLRFQPGQHLTVLLKIGTEEARRSYSFASDPAQRGRLAVTVKRVAGGLVSNWINDRVQPGDRLRVMGPLGRFALIPDASQARDVVLIAGGSGITPLMSMMRSTLRHEPRSRVALVYANRDAASIIFAEAIDALVQASGERASVVHVLDDPSGLPGALGGRLSGDVLERAVPIVEGASYFVCGPEPMMDAVTAHLSARGVPEERVHVERFTAPAASAKATPMARVVESVLRLRGSGRRLAIPRGQTVLEASRAEGDEPIPFSCTMGGCGACRVRVVEGEVVMDEPHCLRPHEVADGYCLTCVARPITPTVVVDV